jgi:hypothetical protein
MRVLSMLKKDIQQLLATFPQARFHLGVPPVGQVAVGRNSRILEFGNKKISGPHDLDLVTPLSFAFPPQQLSMLLGCELRIRRLRRDLLNPSMIWMRA